VSTPIRVLVGDDHVFYREGVKALLATRPDQVTVVGEGATGEEALRLAASARPDIVLMDLNARSRRADRYRETYPSPSRHRCAGAHHLEDDSVLPAIRAGARGFLLKDAGVDDLVRAITAVRRGETILSKQAAEHVHRRLSQAVVPTRPFPELTDREHDLLREILRGRNSQEIASTLGLTSKTVRNYVSNILAKLHARDRADLVVRARETGYPDD
jgi:DNA-binding NarL/FixJ family response regulator